MNETYFSPSQPDRSQCRNPSLSGADPTVLLDYLENLGRAPVGGELEQILETIGNLSSSSEPLYPILDKLLTLELPWREIPSPKSFLVETIIQTLVKLARADHTIPPFNGESFVFEIQTFSKNQTMVFPSSALGTDTRVEPELTSSSPEGSVFLGILLRGSVPAIFSNSKEVDGDRVLLGTEVLHFSALSGIV